MDWTTIFGLIARHALTGLAGFLVAHGLLGSDPSATEGFIGACMLLLGIGWSAWQKYGKVLVDAQWAKLRGHAPVILLAAIIVLAAAPAFAADMPVKNPPRMDPLSYPTTGGFYWGLNTEIGVAQTQVSGTFGGGLVSGHLNAAGGSIGGTVGYVWSVGNRWLALEGNLNYMNITATAPGTSIAFTERWNSSQVAKLGGFEDILANITNLGGFSFPALPSPITPPGFSFVPNTAHPYIMAGVQEAGAQQSNAGASAKMVTIAPLVGAGVMNRLMGANGKPNGAVLDVGAKVVFGNSGLTANFNVNPPIVAARADTGNQYWTYAKVLW